MRTGKPSQDTAEKSSYGEILKSSSIIGGAQVLTYLVDLIRVKAIAVLLGPTGVGLIGLYQSTLGLVGTVTGLGIQSSGVREVAKSSGAKDSASAALTVVVLRRVCWATGLIGWGVTAILSRKISEWLFGDQDHALPIAFLGVTLLLGAVSGGQLALLQGMRRIGDLAKANVIAMLISTGIALALYLRFGEAAIVPVFIATSFMTLLVSWRFARRVSIISIDVNLEDTISSARKLVSLGFAFMWGALLVAGVDLFTRSLIVQEHGVGAAGIYQAAWALSGMFAGFVLGAMGADFYPRLTAAIDNRLEAIRLVNEQIEIGVLLALPGLLATIALAPIVMRVLYTAEFLPAAALLPWFIIGVFCRVISWPLGFVQHAKGAARWFFWTQTIFAVLHLLLIIYCFSLFGLVGVAYAFAAAYCIHAPAMLWVASRLIGFRWSKEVRRLLAFSAVAVAAGVFVSLLVEGWQASVIGTAMAVIGGVASLSGLAARLGPEHRLIRPFLRIPGMARVLRAR